MKKSEIEAEDDLRPEYNLRDLKIRRLGPERDNFCGEMVQLEADVAKVFPDSTAVNEALRFLIRISRENKAPISGSENP